MDLQKDDLKEYKKATELFDELLTTKNLRRKNPKLYSTIIDNLAYSVFKTKGINKRTLSLYLESLKIRDSLKLYSKIVFHNLDG